MTYPACLVDFQQQKTLDIGKTNWKKRKMLTSGYCILKQTFLACIQEQDCKDG